MSIPKGYDPATGHMDFSLALQELKKGRRVRRAEWGKGMWLELFNGRVAEVAGTQQYLVGCSVPSDDLLATDWEEA